MLHQIASLVGAALILAAYVANQQGWLEPAHRAYSLMNFLGALLLLWVAWTDWRWGFIILEAVWAAVSLPALLRPRKT